MRPGGPRWIAARDTSPRPRGARGLCTRRTPDSNTGRAVLEPAPGMFDQVHQFGGQPAPPLSRIPWHQAGESLRMPAISPAADRLPLETAAATRWFDPVFQRLFDDCQLLLHPQSIPWRDRRLVHGAPFSPLFMLEACGPFLQRFFNRSAGRLTAVVRLA